MSIKLQISTVFLTLLLYGCTQSRQSGIFGYSENYPPDLQVLHQNVLINIFDDPTDMEAVEKLLGDLNEDGSWSYIDYTSQERGAWQPREHLTNLLNIARAYQTRSSGYYQKKTVSEKIHLALNYWLENDFICPNWWYPVIGVPMVLNPVMILMEAELSPDQIEKALVVLNRCEIGRTGQNKVWQSGNVLLTSLLVKDVEMVREASESIQEELVVSLSEGVQPDWSYHQHGPQLQFGNYGLSYVGDMIKWTTILRKTPYQFDENKVYILRNYLLDGQQWISWKNQMDISACGRQLFIGSSATKASALSGSINKMKTLDPEFMEVYGKANNYTNLSGNKHFWRSDFQVQRTPEYFFSVKMCSRRVIGAESCNLENIQGYYMGDGATYLYQSGKEYEDIFPFWDWKKIPGTTTHQDNDTLPVLTARGYRIESDFVGGVSDGEDGIAAMKYNRNGLTAQKSWFMFGGKIICLGAGVSSTEGLPVSTSVNQSFLYGEVLIKTDGEEKSAVQVEELMDPDWILHDQIGYLFPNGGKLKLEAKNVEGSWNWVARRYPDERIKADLFKLWFMHGLNPNDQSYAYILVPNANKSVLDEMEKQAPFSILNEKNRQEVISSDGSMAGIVFYQAGKSAVFGGIEVDKACLIMLKKQSDGVKVSVADPTQQLSEINVSLNGKSGGKTLKIILPQGGEAGKTVTDKF
jgi:chondroitin AC lyase